jgi:hypothetical protein
VAKIETEQKRLATLASMIQLQKNLFDEYAAPNKYKPKMRFYENVEAIKFIQSSTSTFSEGYFIRNIDAIQK